MSMSVVPGQLPGAPIDRDRGVTTGPIAGAGSGGPVRRGGTGRPRGSDVAGRHAGTNGGPTTVGHVGGPGPTSTSGALAPPAGGRSGSGNDNVTAVSSASFVLGGRTPSGGLAVEVASPLLVTRTARASTTTTTHAVQVQGGAVMTTRGGHSDGAAALGPLERRRLAEAAARHLHERHVAVYAWGRCDLGQLGIGLPGRGAAGGNVSGEDVNGGNLGGGALHPGHFGGGRGAAMRGTSGAGGVTGHHQHLNAGASAALGGGLGSHRGVSFIPDGGVTSSGPGSGTTAYFTPQRVPACDGRDVVHMSGNVYHGGVVTGDGEVLMTGDNGSGQLGTMLRAPQATPVRLEGSGEFGMPRITALACGQQHTVAVTAAGGLMSWGAAEFGQLGHGPAAGIGVDLLQPRYIAGSREMHFVGVACGMGHTLGLTGSGRVYSFGQGTFGALGHGDHANCDAPALIQSLWAAGIVQVAAGDNHSAALAVNGEVYTWGRGKYGQLGHGDTANASAPERVRALWDAGVTCGQVACGGDHTLAVADGGALLAWGRGASGPAGCGSTADVVVPVRVDPALLGGGGDGTSRVVQVSAGSRHSVALTENGELYSWGDCTQGQLGHAQVDSHPPAPTSGGKPTQGGAGVSGGPPGPHPPGHARSVGGGLDGPHDGQVDRGGRGRWGSREGGTAGNIGMIGMGEGGPVGSSMSIAALPQPATSSCLPAAGSVSVLAPQPRAGATVLPAAKVSGLPARREILFAVAAGDHTVVALGPLKDTGGGIQRDADASPLSRAHHRGLTAHGTALRPTELPALLELAEDAAGAAADLDGSTTAAGERAAAAEASSSSWIIPKLLRATEDVFSSAGFLVEGFMLPGAMDTKVGDPDGARGCGLDVRSIGAVYDALVSLGRAEVVTTLANASARLAEELERALRRLAAEEDEEAAAVAAAEGADAAEDAAEEREARLRMGSNLGRRAETVAACQGDDAGVSAHDPVISSGAAAAAAASTAGIGLGSFVGDGGPGGPASASASCQGHRARLALQDEQLRRRRRRQWRRQEASRARLERAANRRSHVECVVRALLVLWQSPLNGDPAFADALLPRLISALLCLPPTAVQGVLVPWLATGYRGLGAGGEVFETRLVMPVQRFLARRLVSKTQRRPAMVSGSNSWNRGVEDVVVAGAQILGVLYAANERAASIAGARGEGTMVSPEVFYSPALSENLNLREEYMRWIQLSVNGTGAVVGGEGGDIDPSREGEGYVDRGGAAGSFASPSVVSTTGSEPFLSTAPAPSSSSSSSSCLAHLRLGELASFCQLPFLLTPEAKGRILQGEANLQKRHEMRASQLSAMQAGRYSHNLPFGSPDAPFLEIIVDRENLLSNTLDAVARRPPADLKKPLRIKFTSEGVAEEGIDEGGVTKEFFQLLVREMFGDTRGTGHRGSSPGMFTYEEESRMHWFNPASPTDPESLARFRLFGASLGLAIYNGVILDVHLPSVAYSRLMGCRPTLADLTELSPSLGKGLKQLLEYEGDDVELVFCRNFVVEHEDGPGVRSVELLPGGADLPVTAANRGAFVDLYVQHLLDTLVAEPFGAFATGFHQVCGGPALTLFTPRELELLVSGEPDLDIQALQRVTKYDGGFSANHPTVVAFWSVVRDMAVEQKKQLLFFTTGCDRAPVGGLGNLPFVVQRSGPDTSHLPTSHTCFNVLLLPEYSSTEKLRDRLLVAIANAEGFGLQ